MKLALITGVTLSILFVSCKPKNTDTDTNETKQKAEISQMFPNMQTPNFEMKFDTRIGSSFNTATQEVGDVMLKNADKLLTDNNYKTYVNTSTSFITSLDDFSKVFHVSFSGSGAATADWITVGGNAGFDLIKTLAINRYHSYFVFHYISTIKKEYIGNPLELTDNLYEMARDKPNAFIQKVGDKVLTAKILGGELYVVIEVDNYSEESKNEIKSNIDHSMNSIVEKLANFHTSFDISNDVNHLIQTSKHGIILYASGVTGSGTNFTSEDGVKQFISEFAKKLKDEGGAVIEYESLNIKDLQSLPKNFKGNWSAFENKKYNIEQLRIKKFQIEKSQPFNYYVAKNEYDEFDSTAVNQAIKLVNKNYEELNKVNKSISDCGLTGQNCNIDTYIPQEVTPTYFTIEKDHPLKLNTEWTRIAIIPPNKSVAVTLDGYTQMKSDPKYISPNYKVDSTCQSLILNETLLKKDLHLRVIPQFSLWLFKEDGIDPILKSETGRVFDIYYTHQENPILNRSEYKAALMVRFYIFNASDNGPGKPHTEWVDDKLDVKNIIKHNIRLCNDTKSITVTVLKQ